MASAQRPDQTIVSDSASVTPAMDTGFHQNDEETNRTEGRPNYQGDGETDKVMTITEASPDLSEHNSCRENIVIERQIPDSIADEEEQIASVPQSSPPFGSVPNIETVSDQPASCLPKTSDHSPDTVPHPCGHFAQPSHRDGALHMDCVDNSTEDEASDWEGPVDVELELSPARASQPSKVSWSTVKALARWLPRGRSKLSWTQMAGHQGSFLAGPDGTVLKLRVPSEERNLKLLMTEPELRPFVPCYHGTVNKDDVSYVQLQDLLCEFSSPCVMDIKMGTRTYLEEELHKARKKPTLRKDLYQKMVSIDLEAPTVEERQQEAIIKPRYMKFRDDMSSTSSLGFRIEGIKTSSGASKDYRDTRTRVDVHTALSAFLEDNSSALEKYTALLTEIRTIQACSSFFKLHEIVGSSLLFVHDSSGKAGLWMIDFAKCSPLPSTVSTDHRTPWIPGNYEDGYLFGLDNLISIFQNMARSQQNNQ